MPEAGLVDPSLCPFSVGLAGLCADCTEPLVMTNITLDRPVQTIGCKLVTISSECQLAVKYQQLKLSLANSLYFVGVTGKVRSVF